MLEKILESLIDFGTTIGFKIVGAIVVLFVGLKLAKYVMKILKKTRAFQAIDPTAQSFIKSFLSIVLNIVVVITAAAILGVPMTSVVTVVGSCGLAIGLALQGGLSNIAGGLIILLFKPFKVGDYIVEGGFEGTVSSIGIFYTTLLTADNKKVIIPNGSLMNSTVTAVNQMDTRRVDLKFGVDYNTDIDFARGVISDEISKNASVLKDPAPQIVVLNQADSAVEFAVRVWVNTSDYWAVYFALMENVKKAFDKNNINIPFPQMDVHIKQ